MKKLILLLVLIITIKTNAQNSFFTSVGLDPKLITTGAYSYDNTPVLDLQIKLGSGFKENYEIGLQFEYANLNPSYFSLGVFSNYVLNNRKETLKYSAGLELTGIQRGENKRMRAEARDLVFSYGLNAEIRVKIINNYYVGFLLNVNTRPDLKIMYNEKKYFHNNGFIRFIYQIKQK